VIRRLCCDFRAFLLFLVLLAGAALVGCTPVREPPQFRPPPELEPGNLPPMKMFGPTVMLPVERSNRDIARDFLDLSFRLESGAELPVFTRFDPPITISLHGSPTPVFSRELDRLVGRLRREAGLPITRVADQTTATITIEAIGRRDLQRSVPAAACFVLPARITWREFHSNMRRRDLNWSDLRHRIAATVFIPADVSPQEIRDCMHEEVAQALGPLNDLYRLDDSIFNDDNLHSILTGFDMLVLRVTYDPALQAGMTRAEVEAALPAILARINPRGESYPSRNLPETPRNWIAAMEYALAPQGTGRKAAAARALEIAKASGWQDARLGLSYFTMGRLDTIRDGASALSEFRAAEDIYAPRNATQIHAAHVGMQLAAFALVSGRYQEAIEIVDRYVPAARRGENAALLSDLLAVKAAALDALGRREEARLARLDSIGWGRYGSRSLDELQQRQAEIAALGPVVYGAGG
jgi:tetratricopeptide (TPR) repeat protein